MKLKLIEYLITEIKIQKNDFVNKFKTRVNEGGTGVLSDTFDTNYSSKNKYRGYVGSDNFKIKRRNSANESNQIMNIAMAKGSYKQKGDTLIIETVIYSFNLIILLFYLITLILYFMFFIGIFFRSDSIHGNAANMLILFVIVFGVIIIGFPYFMMRKSTKSMKNQLKKDFRYLARK